MHLGIGKHKIIRSHQRSIFVSQFLKPKQGRTIFNYLLLSVHPDKGEILSSMTLRMYIFP